MQRKGCCWIWQSKQLRCWPGVPALNHAANKSIAANQIILSLPACDPFCLLRHVPGMPPYPDSPCQPPSPLSPRPSSRRS